MNDKVPKSEGIEINIDNPEWPLLASLMGAPDKYDHWGPISIEWARYRSECVPEHMPVDGVEFLQHAFYCGYQSMMEMLIKSNAIRLALENAPERKLEPEIMALRDKDPFDVVMDAIRYELDAYHLQQMSTEGEA